MPGTRAYGSERSCAYCGQPFRPVHGATAGRFCSRPCYWAEKRKYDRPAIMPCAHCGQPFKTSGQRATARFCSHACYSAAKRKPAGPIETFVCAQCGVERARRAGPEGRRQFLCSRACAALHRRKAVALTCPQCGASFTRKPSAVALGAGRFCSVACRGLAQRRRVERPCARCQQPFSITPGQLQRGRRYCSVACYVGPDGDVQEISCQLCGQPRRVRGWHLRHGYGKYCSRAHFWEARRQAARQARPRLTCARAGCRKAFWVSPCQASRRKYCSQRCVRLAHARRRFHCQCCRVEFRVPPWRKSPQFCSLSCANRGRRREPRPALVARNVRILELDALGWKAADIQQRLPQEDSAWGASTAVIYQVVSLARRQGAGA